MGKHRRVIVGSAACVAVVGLISGGILWAQKPPSDPPATLSDQQLSEIETIRRRLGSVVPADSLLGTAGPVPSVDAAPTLKAGDPLLADLADWSSRLEARARQEAAQGNWDVGIPLHQISQQMRQLIPRP